jgi:hypothetical protein
MAGLPEEVEPVVVSDAQVRKLMTEMREHGQVGRASLRSGMHRNTARRYVESGKLPSAARAPRSWRTREDPFAEDWPEVAGRLEQAPELEAKALFEDLLGRRPERYEEGHLRTFQRRVRRWRAEYGPDREVFFAQAHRPGEALQTDFTSGRKLAVTIGGEPFDHLLCQSVLPYSNWQSVTVCQSESMLALRRGVQTAAFALGRVPGHHQTDNSTAATHDLGSGKRAFNEEYAALMRHLGMAPRTIGIGQSHQNGDVEAAHGALKRALEQHLLLRGDRDFDSVAAYEVWVSEKVAAANARRARRLAEELAVMRPLAARRLPEVQRLVVRVSSHGTIRVKNNIYSVPSRLIGERVEVVVDERSVEVHYAGRLQMAADRLGGEGKHRINYRHVIWSLVQKPWAFPRYRYRPDLFPQEVFRRAYDRLVEGLDERRADLEYLRILHLAAATMESEVAAALELVLADGELPRFTMVRSLVVVARPEVPEMAPLTVDLGSYDELLVAAAGGAR